MSKVSRQMSVSDFREKVFKIASLPSKFLPLTVTKDGKPVFDLLKSKEVAAPKKPAKKAAPKKK